MLHDSQRTPAGHYRDCRAMWLEEGPPTVQRITAARGLIASGGYTF